MKTKTPHINAGALAGLLGLAAVPLVVLALLALSASPPVDYDIVHVGGWGDEGAALAGAAARQQDPRAIEAAFPRESYTPGTTAGLRCFAKLARVELQVFHVGPEWAKTVGNMQMRGVPVTARTRIGTVVPGRTIRVRIGDWPTGLYFAQLTAPHGRIGYAPFVVPPKRLGRSRVAVVLPTHTWQAYNFRDDDGDGLGDTWYATCGRTQARLGRPHLNRGVPYHFRSYDVHFLHWLHRTGKRVDVLAQEDLDELHDPGALRRAYDLLIFPGHHEYVTTAEYDAVEGYRDRGGSLVFLSANNYFWRVDIRDNVMTRVRKWRELGRPEAALLGVQYIGNDDGRHRGAWMVRSTAATGWLFAGTSSSPGGRFSNAGIEIDHTCSSSPHGTKVVAEIPNLLGPGMTGQMSYYETARGAKVFSAGAFTLAGSIRQRPVARLLENLWARITGPSAVPLH
jgi:hypothetical protein